ncbi:Gfo/Idh/MocA family protein [Maribacter chungangensis]|uniref:Gfo/Idh/MocA family protein n=1 Tax=Maribacter chungangensis TaxID=1069117 RepID=A0ABW3B0K5_9FLAO
MKTVKWGIIGCGDVAEVKSGPAFQKVKQSELIAVMRRNKSKAEDFAKRHKVPFHYDTAAALLGHKGINAVYIATPPSTHLKYTLMALDAGKDVYLEKPMTLNFIEGKIIAEALKNTSGKLTVAHYRRKLPAFEKVKQLLGEGAIGKVQCADIQILQPRKSELIADTDDNWRLRPEVSGGGYFYDIAPHQIDLMYHYFGVIKGVAGFSSSDNTIELVDDLVNGIIHFESGVQFRGIWNFTASGVNKKEECVIYGAEGSIRFSFYGEEVQLQHNNGTEVFSFKNPDHVQQPMIAAVVDYFLDKAENPCPVEDGLVVMQTMEQLCGRWS